MCCLSTIYMYSILSQIILMVFSEKPEFLQTTHLTTMLKKKLTDIK